MRGTLDAVAGNPLVSIGGLVCGVIGIVLAIVFYIRGRRVSSIKYDYLGRSLVEGLSGALEGIEVRYKGSVQDRITVSRFAFWNAGTETIRAGDLTDDALRVACKQGIQILDHRVVETNDVTNKISLGAVQNAEDEASVSIRFDYLDPNDGAVLQIVHDGHERTRFRLVGSLKGSCSIARSESPASRRRDLSSGFDLLAVLPDYFGWVGFVIYFAFGLLALVAPFAGASWWWLIPMPFCFIASWVMLRTVVMSQVPGNFRRGLGELPTAGRPSERTL